MKPFVIWLACTLASFAGLGGGYHAALTASPRKVLVIVDSSFPMQPVWGRVKQAVERLEDRRYTQFGLATEKGPVHGWRGRLKLGQLAAYAPRNFDKLAQRDFPEIGEATEVYLVTNAPDDELDRLDGWTVIRP
jgi:hypothetical protein